MLVRTVGHEWRTVTWLMIVALALALLMCWATAVGAADDVRAPQVTPGPLPADIGDWSRPMGGAAPRDEATRIEATRDEAEVGGRVWEALSLHAAQNYGAAIRVWQSVDLPPATHAWKYVALGQAHLALEQLPEAEEALSIALDLRPENGAAYYFVAVLRLEQGFLAREWPDRALSHRIRLAAVGRWEVVPNTRSMYELAAAMAFERSIALAPDVWLDEPLVPLHMSRGMALEPTVGDLLLALGARDYAARAHNALGWLFLDCGSLEMAEQHLDQAVAGGIDTIDGYQQLAHGFRSRGEYLNASRAYWKALQHGDRPVSTGLELLENVYEALTRPR